MFPPIFLRNKYFLRRNLAFEYAYAAFFLSTAEYNIDVIDVILMYLFSADFHFSGTPKIFVFSPKLSFKCLAFWPTIRTWNVLEGRFEQ